MKKKIYIPDKITCTLAHWSNFVGQESPTLDVLEYCLTQIPVNEHQANLNVANLHCLHLWVAVCVHFGMCGDLPGRSFSGAIGVVILLFSREHLSEHLFITDTVRKTNLHHGGTVSHASHVAWTCRIIKPANECFLAFYLLAQFLI